MVGVRHIPVACTWRSSLQTPPPAPPGPRWAMSWAGLEAEGGSVGVSHSTSACPCGSPGRLPRPGTLHGATWRADTAMPSALPGTPRFLGPTAKGLFSLKPIPRAKPKGTLG